MSESIISRVEIVELNFDVKNLGVPEGTDTAHSGGTPGGAMKVLFWASVGFVAISAGGTWKRLRIQA